VLVVLSRNDETGWLSLRNVPEVHLLAADQLNTYDVLVSDDVVFTREALEEFLGIPVTVGDAVASDVDDESGADESDVDDEAEEAQA